MSDKDEWIRDTGLGAGEQREVESGEIPDRGGGGSTVCRWDVAKNEYRASEDVREGEDVNWIQESDAALLRLQLVALECTADILPGFLKQMKVIFITERKFITVIICVVVINIATTTHLLQRR